MTLYHYGEGERPDRVEQHLETCERCAAAYRDLARALALVGELEVPERGERYGLEVWERIRHELPPREPAWRQWLAAPAWSSSLRTAAAVAVLVVLAFVAGRIWPGGGPPAADPGQAQGLAALRQELREVRQMLMLSLLQQQSASERLRGVSGSAEIDDPDAAVVRALLDTLQHDPNVNVRLAAVDALRRFGMQEAVRSGTIQALGDSSFPLVQIALIDLVVEQKDSGAVEALRQLAQDEHANESVRSRATWGLERLSS